MKNKSSLNIEKNIQWEKNLHFNLQESSTLKTNDLKKYFDEEYKQTLKNQFWNCKFPSES